MATLTTPGSTPELPKSSTGYSPSLLVHGIAPALIKEKVHNKDTFLWKIFFPCVLCSTFNSIFLVKVYVGIKALVTSSFVHDVAETKYKRIYVFTVFRIYISRRFFIILIMIGCWY